MNSKEAIRQLEDLKDYCKAFGWNEDVEALNVAIEETKGGETMTNHKKYKDKIDTILERGKLCAFDRNTHKFVECCVEIGCEDCLFSTLYNNDIPCYVNICKWLVAEHKEPEVDWSKIPIDTPVLVNNNRFQGGNAFWIKMHFAGVDTKGNPLVYSNGRSSWSNGIKPIVLRYDDIKLAEVDNE